MNNNNIDNKFRKRCILPFSIQNVWNTFFKGIDVAIFYDDNGNASVGKIKVLFVTDWKDY